MALSASSLVNVSVNLSPLAAAGRSFGVLCIAGDSNVIGGAERLRTYTTLSGVVTDFGVGAPEYAAASLYFGQSPSPATLMIGRWLRTATSALNLGGILTAGQQALSNFTSITNGSLNITIDGVAKTLTGLNFTTATNLNGVATIITTALSGAGTVIWDGNEFSVVSATMGSGSNATGTITLTANPAASDTVTIAGTTVTFVTSGPTGNQVLIGTNAISTAANLYNLLSASNDTNLKTATYSLASNVVNVNAVATGVAGNAFSLAKSSTAITLSGATLAGGAVPSSVGFGTAGTGTDLSAALKLNAAGSQALVAGFAAETPVGCAAALADKSSGWYGLAFAASTMPTDDQNFAVSGFIEAASPTRIFGVSNQDTGSLSSVVTTDMGSRLVAAGFKRSTEQFSSSSPYSVASMLGRAFSVDFNANRSTITLMYKQEPGITAENLSATQALALKNKRINSLETYSNGTLILQYGTMAGPAFFDEIHGLDWLQDAIQTACFNVLYTSTTKIPQTDSGTNQLANAVAGVCQQAVTNGLAAPGIWTAAGFGQLVTGQYLKAGFYIYPNPISAQSQADREARISPPIQVAIKLAGAIQSLNVIVNVNR